MKTFLKEYWKMIIFSTIVGLILGVMMSSSSILVFTLGTVVWLLLWLSGPTGKIWSLIDKIITIKE